VVRRAGLRPEPAEVAAWAKARAGLDVNVESLHFRRLLGRRRVVDRGAGVDTSLVRTPVPDTHERLVSRAGALAPASGAPEGAARLRGASGLCAGRDPRRSRTLRLDRGVVRAEF